MSDEAKRPSQGVLEGRSPSNKMSDEAKRPSQGVLEGRSPSNKPSDVPFELGRYRLKRLLGSGAMGEVWEADDREHGTRVAVKIMKPSAVGDGLAIAKSRFVREAKIAALLRHPNIVSVRDSGEIDGTSFLVMDLVEGRTLRTLIGVPTPLADKVRWLRQIGEALAAMHQAGLVHRDVKPDNIIIRDDGSACLVDLGIAKWTSPAHAATLGPGEVSTATDIVIGTPDYLPTETRHAGIFDEKSDQYAWAVTAYELVAGVHPWDVNDRPLTERAELPRVLTETIDRARSRLPASRFDDLTAALAELAKTPFSPAQEARADAKKKTSARQRPTRSRTKPFVLGLGVVLGVGALALFLGSGHPPGRAPTASLATYPPPTPSTTTASEEPSDAGAPADIDPAASSRPDASPADAGRKEPRRAGVNIEAWYAPPHIQKAFRDQNREAFAACGRQRPLCRKHTYQLHCILDVAGNVHDCGGGPVSRDYVTQECFDVTTCLADAIHAHRLPPYDGSENSSFNTKITFD